MVLPLKQCGPYWCQTREWEETSAVWEFLVNLSEEIMGIAYIAESSYNFLLCLHIFPMFSRCPLLSCSELDIQEKDDFFFYTSFSCVHHVLNASSSTHLLFQLFCLKRKSWTGIHDCNSWREKYKEEERGILKLAVNTPALYLQKLYRVAYCITWNIAYR